MLPLAGEIDYTATSVTDDDVDKSPYAEVARP
jgi:hypothetical protein